MNQPTRRNFLKLIGGGAAAAGLAQIVGCHDEKTKYVSVVQPSPGVQCADAVDFYLNDAQQMGDERETITAIDLCELLKGTTLANANGGATKVHQYLHFGSPSNGMTFNPLTGAVIYGQNEYNQVGNFLFFKDGDAIFEHDLEFEEGLDSVVDANGNLTTLVGQTIPFLGNDYRVFRAQHFGNALELELFAGAFKSQMVGSPQMYVVNDKEYDVFINSIDANNNTEYRVNGEFTPVMLPGQRYQLADGTMFAHLKTAGSSPASMVADFALNADFMALIDDNLADNQSQPFLTRNNEVIEDASLKMLGAPLPNGNFELSSIRYKLLGDFKVGDGYIGQGQSLSQMLDEPAGILGKGFDIQYEGIANGKHLVRVCSK